MRALLREEFFHAPFRARTKQQDALLAIVLDPGWAKHLGHLTAGKTARHVHLPQTVLGCHIALSEEKILESGGIDSGDPMGIAGDGDRRGYARDLYTTVHLGKSGVTRMVEPKNKRKKTEQDKAGKNQDVEDDLASGAGV